MSDVLPADAKGNGWRLSKSGARWYRIEPGTTEFLAWVRHYRATGQEQLARFLEGRGREGEQRHRPPMATFVPSPLPRGEP